MTAIPPLASNPSTQIPLAPGPEATGHWRVSLSEIDALGRKAARGAGYPWGLAEEAGRSARWLAAWGLPGPQMLLDLLDAVDGRLGDHAPLTGRDPWIARAGALCPVATGAALSDRAADIAGGRPIALGPLLHPLLALVPVWRAARDLDAAIALRGSGIDLVALPQGPAAADWTAPGAARVAGLVVERAGPFAHPPLRAGAGAHPLSVESWRALDRYAHRTYVPASDASRRGAGAGLRDTD